MRFLILPILMSVQLILPLRALGADAVIKVGLSTKGNNVAFDQSALQVPAGKAIEIEYVNEASPNSGISHNIFILDQGTEEKFIEEMKKTGYSIKKLQALPYVLGHTKNLKPGQSDRITLSGLKPGYYTYICTMPGHGDMLNMRGVLRVGDSKQ